jgi:diaminopimelate epimerase
VRHIADRRFGIGCDQVLIVEPPDQPDIDFRYRIYNADGGEVEQCGNGARCFARFVLDQRLTNKRVIRVQTLAGVITLRVTDDNEVEVDMGAPRCSPVDVPFIADKLATTYTLDVASHKIDISAISMGNPHAVLVVDNVDTAPVAEWGPLIERHSHFPNRVNAGFMQVVNRQHIRLRVYERGAGETLACGTGACAAVVAGIQRGLLDSPVTVSLSGGQLHIGWEGDQHPVMMKGTATTVFRGQFKL